IGRIDNYTNIDTDTIHASAYYNFANQFWNTRNPYALQKAPFLLHEFGGSVSGPINKRSSFFLDVRRDHVDNESIINTVTLDPVTLAIGPFTGFYRTQQRRISV